MTSIGTYIDQTEVSRVFKHILPKTGVQNPLSRRASYLVLNLAGYRYIGQHGTAKGGALESARHHRHLWECDASFPGRGG